MQRRLCDGMLLEIVADDVYLSDECKMSMFLMSSSSWLTFPVSTSGMTSSVGLAVLSRPRSGCGCWLGGGALWAATAAYDIVGRSGRVQGLFVRDDVM